MNGYRDQISHCSFHPQEVVVGVCAQCLNERLIFLAAKQARLSSSARATTNNLRNQSDFAYHKPSVSLSKIFAFGSLLGGHEFRQGKAEGSDDEASTSPEESFISIKFEENGLASWEKNRVPSKLSLDNCSMTWEQGLSQKDTKENKSVIEHARPRASLRWRKRIGHFFHLIRWKRSNKGNVCHVSSSKVEGGKGRKSWIRSFIKARTVERE